MKAIKIKTIVIVLLIIFFGLLFLFGQVRIFEGATTKTTAASTTTATTTPTVQNIIQSPNSYTIDVYYYIKDKTVSASSFPIAYINHNLPSCFNVYFTESRSIFIENTKLASTTPVVQNMTNSQAIMPVCITKSYALSTTDIKKNTSDPMSKTWYTNQTWGYGPVSPILTLTASQTIKVYKATNEPAPPVPPNTVKSANYKTPPTAINNDDFNKLNKGNIITFQASYDSMALTNNITPGSKDNDIIIKLASINVTFLKEICAC